MLHPPEKNPLDLWNPIVLVSQILMVSRQTGDSDEEEAPLTGVCVSPPPQTPHPNKACFFSFNGWWTTTQAWLVVGLILIQVVITYRTFVIICLVFVPQVLLRQSCLDNVSNDWKTSQYSVSDERIGDEWHQCTRVLFDTGCCLHSRYSIKRERF